MAENKTKPTTASVLDFLNSVENEKRREDGLKLFEIFNEVLDEPAVMWGESIVGYGEYHYKYDSGREGDFLLTGFAPRKSNLSVYIMPGFKRYAELLEKLGKHRTGASCLYINKLENIDQEVLKTLIAESVQYMKDKYH